MRAPDRGRLRPVVFTALWALVALALVLPENLPALALWGRHTLFFPAAVALLGVGLLATEGRAAFVPPPRLAAAYLALGVALAWIVASAFALRAALPPVSFDLVAADAVRVVFAVVALETLRRLSRPVPRVFAVLVPLLVLEALALLFAFRGLGVAARPSYFHVQPAHVVTLPRVFSGIGDPNFTALTLVVGVGGALGFALAGRRAAVRLGGLVAALLLAAALVRTVSLGGLIGLLTLLALLLVGIRGLGLETWTRRRLILAAVALLLALAVLGGGVFWVRVRSEIHRSLASPMEVGDYRVDLFVGGARMLLAHPWRGVGPGRVAPLMLRYAPRAGAPSTPQTCHDFLLGLGDESGLVPLGIVAVLLVLLVAALGRRLWPVVLGRARADPWGVVVTSTLLATLLQALALPAQRDPFVWLVVALAVAHLLADPPRTAAADVSLA